MREFVHSTELLDILVAQPNFDSILETTIIVVSGLMLLFTMKIFMK